MKSRDGRLLGKGRVIGEGAPYLPTGHLVYAQSGGLVATPFDPSSGTPLEVHRSVGVKGGTPQADVGQFRQQAELVVRQPEAFPAKPDHERFA
jgi:hypothetical protein